MIERPSFLTPCLSRDAIRAQRIRRLRRFLGGYICSLFLFWSLASLDRHVSKAQKGCSEGLSKVQWIEQIPSEAGKIFLDPLVLGLHLIFTVCHVIHPNMYQSPTFHHVPPVLSPPALHGGCWNPAAAGPLTSEGWTHLAPVSGSKSRNACLGVSVRKSGR